MKLTDYKPREFVHRIPTWYLQSKTVLQRDGVRAFLKRVYRKGTYFVFGGNIYLDHKLMYGDWMENIEGKYLNEEYMQGLVTRIGKGPKFSIIFPTWNKEMRFYQTALASILAQKYDNWELCISDASTQNVRETREYLKGFRDMHADRVTYGELKDPPEINLIENTKNAVRTATGEFLVFMDCDDELSPNCLLELAWAIKKRQGKVDFLYSDFDKMSPEGERFFPSFWPDWSPHTLLSQMYATHVTCYRRSIYDKIGGLREGTVGAQDWDLVLRLSEVVDRKRIVHIPKVLYHWKMFPGSTALENSGAKDWVYPIQKNILEDWVKRNGETAEVIPDENRVNLRVKFAIKKLPNGKMPLVSIIIPFRDKVSYLKRCLTSIEQKTEYQNYEILLVDNQSKEPATLRYLDSLVGNPGGGDGIGNRCRLFRYDRPYHFGKINNLAAKQAKGEHLLLLNNDTTVINSGWLSAMLEYSQRPEVGAVGAKLLYPDGRIQHAGVIVGIGAAAGHSHRLLRSDVPGYNGWVVSIRNVSAVTGACMMIKRSLFLKEGGFDPIYDPAYQDVDFCLRIYEQGYWNVYTPYAQLYHYESVTRFSKELKGLFPSDEENAKKLRKRWPHYLGINFCADPFYNVNLIGDREDFKLRVIWVSDEWGRRMGLVE